MDFIEELTWRGMIHTVMPGTDEQLKKGMTTAYLGIDPTADSLHIGHLCGVMMLRHFPARCGHKPLALVGGATGMIGDPSGKSLERNLLDEETLRHNQDAIKKQLSKFLDFESDAPNKAEMVNNYDWTKDVTFLDFAREIGKHITVNYMMAKDSVQKRLNGEARDGLSFTEFTYQLLQGFDFLTLYRDKDCKLQLGGCSDQWGNITTGTDTHTPQTRRRGLRPHLPAYHEGRRREVRQDRKRQRVARPALHFPYKFYQFWLNVSDADAEKYLKIFTSLTKEEIDALVAEHAQDPGQRPMQNRLAREVTIMVHSEADYNAAVEASQILFSNKADETLRHIDEKTLLEVFEGVPTFTVSKSELEAGVPVLDLLAAKSGVFASKGEARKMVQQGGVSINKKKVTDPNAVISAEELLNGKYLLAQRGKKNYFLLIAE